MLKTGALTASGFQLQSGVIGEVQLNERKTRMRIAKLINEI